ncbi:MAG: transketolase, partial [Acidimicrobiia bacterium]
VVALRQELDWPYEPFVVPADVRAHLAGPIGRARAGRRAWDLRVAAWEAAHPDLARERRRRLEGELPPGVFDDLPTFEPGERLPTRVASGRTLAALGRVLPELVGGAADLTESTCAATGGPVVAPGPSSGTQIHFGVREHAMLAAANGLALYGGFRPFGATFLVFSDYARPALRLAALMHLPVVVVCTHDSIGLGEDGPTHQPVEHLAALRAMPGVAVLRPADANETVEAWRTALERRQGPTVLVLSRQALPVLRPDEPGWMARRGARIVRGAAEPDVVLVATGSEVALALHAADRLTERNVATRVVSMPWRERFCSLPPEQRQAILPPGVPVLAIEAGVAQGWAEVTGERGAVASLDRYGASGPGQEVLAHFGFTADSIAARALAVLGERGGSAA